MVWLETIKTRRTGSCWLSQQTMKLLDSKLALDAMFPNRTIKSSCNLQSSEDSKPSVSTWDQRKRGDKVTKCFTSDALSMLINDNINKKKLCLRGLRWLNMSYPYQRLKTVNPLYTSHGCLKFHFTLNLSV